MSSRDSFTLFTQLIRFVAMLRRRRFDVRAHLLFCREKRKQNTKQYAKRLTNQSTVVVPTNGQTNRRPRPRPRIRHVTRDTRHVIRDARHQNFVRRSCARRAGAAIRARRRRPTVASCCANGNRISNAKQRIVSERARILSCSLEPETSSFLRSDRRNTKRNLRTIVRRALPAPLPARRAQTPLVRRHRPPPPRPHSSPLLRRSVWLLYVSVMLLLLFFSNFPVIRYSYLRLNRFVSGGFQLRCQTFGDLNRLCQIGFQLFLLRFAVFVCERFRHSTSSKIAGRTKFQRVQVFNDRLKRANFCDGSVAFDLHCLCLSLLDVARRILLSRLRLL